MKILHLAIFLSLAVLIAGSNATYAQNVTNSTSPIPYSILRSASPTLTPSETQSLINVALSIPGLQQWSHDWRYIGMGFLGNNKLATGGFEWQYAILNLKAPSSSAPISCDNDWWAWIEIDMTTMKVVQATYPTIESHNCQIATSGGPESGGVQMSNTASIESPLKQFNSGISAKDVKCNVGLLLVIKSEDGTPACVKLDAVSMLVERGWALNESAYPKGNAQFALETNSTIIPGHLPRHSGLLIPYQESSRIINYSGFVGVYNETLLYRGKQQDYVLTPGKTGAITFNIDAWASEQPDQHYPTPLPKSLNMTNYAVFHHEITSLDDLSKYPGVTFDGNHSFTACSATPGGGDACIGGPLEGANPIEAYVVDHPGVTVLFEPPAEVLPLGTNTTSQQVTMMITADRDAPRGTYLVEPAPFGSDTFLLTVGNQPYHE